jgi:hypothetical protein
MGINIFSVVIGIYIGKVKKQDKTKYILYRLL